MNQEPNVQTKTHSNDEWLSAIARKGWWWEWRVLPATWEFLMCVWSPQSVQSPFVQSQPSTLHPLATQQQQHTKAHSNDEWLSAIARKGWWWEWRENVGKNGVMFWFYFIPHQNTHSNHEWLAAIAGRGGGENTRTSYLFLPALVRLGRNLHGQDSDGSTLLLL